MGRPHDKERAPTMAAPPIDPRLLEPCLRPFPNEARTLPAEAYLSEDVFAWERRHFFEGSWFCLGSSTRAGTEDTSCFRAAARPPAIGWSVARTTAGCTTSTAASRVDRA